MTWNRYLLSAMIFTVLAGLVPPWDVWAKPLSYLFGVCAGINLAMLFWGWERKVQ